MIKNFKSSATADVFNDRASRNARRICPESIWRTARRKLEQLDSVDELQLLSVPPGNRLEALKGDRKGQYSVRINNQWRICFEWPKGAKGPSNVEIVDYH